MAEVDLNDQQVETLRQVTTLVRPDRRARLAAGEDGALEVTVGDDRFVIDRYGKLTRLAGGQPTTIIGLDAMLLWNLSRELYNSVERHALAALCDLPRGRRFDVRIAGPDGVLTNRVARVRVELLEVI